MARPSYNIPTGLDEELVVIPRESRRKLGTLYRLDQQATNADKVGQAQFGDIELSEEQDVAFRSLKHWVEHTKLHPGEYHVKTLGGLAGTGKTTILGFFARYAQKHYNVAYCALTGKASSVLLRSLRSHGVDPGYCGTVHGLMYQPQTDEETGAILGWGKNEAIDYDLIVVDEASMLSGELLDDLASYRVPILAVGDHGQLPPVGEDAGVMQDPDIRLEKVLRQACDNPIIALSIIIRRGGDWRSFVKQCQDPRIQHVDAMEATSLAMNKFKGVTSRPMSEDPLLLCGTNRMRAELNRAARIPLQTDEILVPGERIIVLKNQRLSGMFLANGFLGKVTGLGHAPNPLHVCAHVNFADEGLELRNGMMCRAQFGAPRTIREFGEVNPDIRSWHEIGLLVDYGYAITCHKSQGSQSDNVVVCVERMGMGEEEFRRWLYTAASRSTKNLTMVF